MKKRIALSRSASGYLQRRENEIATAALAALFTATGATRASYGNIYTLNGVEGISKEEMCRIYNCKERIYHLSRAGIFAGEKIRTIVPATGNGNMLQINGEDAFAGSECEVIKFGESQEIECGNKELMPKAFSLKGTFSNCYALHTIYPINTEGITDIGNDTFAGCTALQEIRLNSLQSSIDISEASNITFKSIRYIVENAANSSAIAIRVHPTTYMYITGRNESNTPKAEWENVREKATERRILFTTTCFVAHVYKETLCVSMGEIEKNTLKIGNSDAATEGGILMFA